MTEGFDFTPPLTVEGEPRVFISRAAIRTVEPGTSTWCHSCEDPIKFNARKKPKEVICNVYDDGQWQGVERYHTPCYEAVGSPYGEASVDPPMFLDEVTEIPIVEE